MEGDEPFLDFGFQLGAQFPWGLFLAAAFRGDGVADTATILAEDDDPFRYKVAQVAGHGADQG